MIKAKDFKVGMRYDASYKSYRLDKKGINYPDNIGIATITQIHINEDGKRVYVNVKYDNPNKNGDRNFTYILDPEKLYTLT